MNETLTKKFGQLWYVVAIVIVLLIVAIATMGYYLRSWYEKGETAHGSKASFVERATAGPAMGPGPVVSASGARTHGIVTRNPCGPGKFPVYSSSGNQVYCQSASGLPPVGGASCGRNGMGGSWAPEAAAEANGLQAAGALESDVYYGEHRLNRQIGNNPATGQSGAVMSDAQLTQYLHSGGGM